MIEKLRAIESSGKWDNFLEELACDIYYQAELLNESPKEAFFLFSKAIKGDEPTMAITIIEYFLGIDSFEEYLDRYMEKENGTVLRDRDGGDV